MNETFDDIPDDMEETEFWEREAHANPNSFRRLVLLSQELED